MAIVYQLSTIVNLFSTIGLPLRLVSGDPPLICINHTDGVLLRIDSVVLFTLCDCISEGC